MVDVKSIIEETGGLYKFGGVVPEGFVLIHEKTLEDLKEFRNWTMWKRDIISLNDLDKKHFNEETI
jgi:hypothetical protein